MLLCRWLGMWLGLWWGLQYGQILCPYVCYCVYVCACYCVCGRCCVCVCACYWALGCMRWCALGCISCCMLGCTCYYACSCGVTGVFVRGRKIGSGQGFVRRCRRGFGSTCVKGWEVSNEAEEVALTYSSIVDRHTRFFLEP